LVKVKVQDWVQGSVLPLLATEMVKALVLVLVKE
jgi:hypothetical protein